MERLLLMATTLALSSPMASAQSHNCKPTADLSQELGPVYNQGDDLGSCFANTAADQLTQKMRREGALKRGERIQPLALWALYTLDDGRLPSQSKDVVSTPLALYKSLNSLRKRNIHALCRESEFGSRHDSNMPLFSQADLAEMAKFKSQLQPPSTDTCDLESQKLHKQIREIKNAAYFTWWDALRTTCRTPAPILNPQTAAAKGRKYQQMLGAEIDKALDRGLIVGIEYQPRFLLKQRKEFRHWSNIVERKTIGDKCYYRIRDSFGASCTRFKRQELCKDGYIWVEKDRLLDHTDAFTYIE